MKKLQNFNYHGHTFRCGHADSTMSDEDFVREFINKGFKKISFTDHCPHKDGIDDRRVMRMAYNQKDEYLKSIEKLKEKYSGIIEIETGCEVEYRPGKEEDLLELKNESDRIVLGQHFILGKDNELIRFRYHDFTDEELLTYAKYLDMAMEKHIPDLVAHPDLYMINRESFGDIEAKVAHIICSSAEKHNIPLEINLTEAFLYLSNMKNRVYYPCKEFWEIASNYNIKVVYSIDAHYKEQIRMYEECIEFVNNLIGKDIIEKFNFIENIGE